MPETAGTRSGIAVAAALIAGLASVPETAAQVRNPAGPPTLAGPYGSGPGPGPGPMPPAPFATALPRDFPSPVERMFDMLDADHDGVVTVAEALKRVDDLFDAIDQNKDGALDKSEFDTWFGRANPEAARFFLVLYDIDGDGKVTRAEFESPEKKRFALFDRNDDGKVTPQELAFARMTLGGGPIGPSTGLGEVAGDPRLVPPAAPEPMPPQMAAPMPPQMAAPPQPPSTGTWGPAPSWMRRGGAGGAMAPNWPGGYGPPSQGGLR